MNNSKNYIRSVLNDALLKGELQGSEKIVDILLDKIRKQEVLSREESENIIQKLQMHQRNVFERRKKLSNINLLNSIGEYIQLWQEEEELNDKEMAEKLNLDCKELSMIRENIISPIKIESQKMSKILHFFRLKFNEAKELVEKTYILFNIELSSQAALSRYDEKKPAEYGKSMKGAIEELLTKANQKKPLIERNQDDLKEYIQKLEKYWE